MSVTPPSPSETPPANPPSETPSNTPPTPSPSTAITGDPPANPASPEWLKTLPEEYQSHPSLKTYKDLPSFVKSSLEQEKMLGKEKIVKPGENATEEELNKYYNSLGRPEKPESYEFKKPEDWPETLKFNDDLVPKVKDMFHKAGVPADMAKKLWDSYHDMVKTQGSESLESSQKDIDAALDKLKEEWGGQTAYNANIEKAKVAVRELGGDELVQFLNSTGLGNHPALIKAFANAGNAFIEDGGFKVTGGGGGFTETPEAAKAEIDRLQKDPEFTKILYSTQLKDQELKKEYAEKWKRLHRQAYPTFTKS